MLKLSLSIAVPGDSMLGIASTLDILVEALPFVTLIVSIMVEQSEKRHCIVTT